MSASDPRSILTAAVGGAPLDVAKVRGHLDAKRLGTKFHYFAEIGSTNTHARELAEKGAAEGEVVLAESQTHGRGRLGRRWESPPFANLYFSVILRPKLAPVYAPQITLTAAVALAEAIDSLIPLSPVIKWPNDILVNGKKLAGILAEAVCARERVEYVILGIGVNVNCPVDAMSQELRQRATSLFDVTRIHMDREFVLRRLIQDLDRCYGDLEQFGFEAIAPQWEARFGLRGKRVRIELRDQVLIGRARGLARDGTLLVEGDDGILQKVIAGDVIPLEI
ncbi:MAG TPA: biotin--[acetyl-CoA-carboxylase] ligase [Verrucomicrobiae bacterium]|nr:biotin--[acetyl-CoA-carboxylase] ligase [Verrucomicrobiae bacterium]